MTPWLRACLQVAALAAAGRSVLLASYTNSAVDNVLLKLRAAGVGFLRLGRSASIHAGVRDALPGGARHLADTVAALRLLAATARVVSNSSTPYSLEQPIIEPHPDV